MNSLQVKSKAHFGKCPMRILLYFIEQGKQEWLSCSAGAPRGLKASPREEHLVGEHKGTQHLQTPRDWVSIICNIYIYYMYVLWLEMDCSCQKTSGVITPPVYFGMAPHPSMGGPSPSQDSFGIFFFFAPLCWNIYKFGGGAQSRGVGGREWRKAAGLQDAVLILLTPLWWCSGRLFTA